MACPWFYPLERLGPAESVLPLVDAWAGECRAPGCDAVRPERSTLLDCCNMGYARAACRLVPAGGPDAVRFSVTRHKGAAVGLCCVVERDYLPFGGAALEFDTQALRFAVPHPDPNLDRQARAYLESYLLRKRLS
jgi:hypothetical protein